MQFSFWSSNDRPWDETIELARWAERSGFQSFWYPDHFMSTDDSNSEERGQDMALDCWTILTAVGALVPRLRLVSMVSPVTIHHPVVLAKRAATLDLIAPGRVVLGLGAGWQVNEHQGYGFDLPSASERVDRFAEAIEAIRLLFTQDRADLSGQYYNLRDATFVPRPDNVQLMVGTSGARMMRLTAQFGDHWNTWGSPAQIRVRTAAFMKACDEVGRDPSTIERSAQAMIYLTDSDARRDKLRARLPPGNTMVGSANELIEMMGTYVELGVDEFAIDDFTLGNDAAARRDALDRLLTEVVSHFM
jgi:alkanesulfonate monooxygenase SsuD/methylene tetrahydromethanopterin reductase-like flavin-dependent oxidoreductase (luciferase family)